MTIDEAKHIFNEIKKKDPTNTAQYLIRGRGPIGMLTLKGYDSNNIIEFDDDYFINGGADEEVFYLEFTIRK